MDARGVWLMTCLAHAVLKHGGRRNDFSHTSSYIPPPHPPHPPAPRAQLCSEKLRTEFIEHPDQNLKFLGLQGLVSLMRSHPRVVAEHKDLVIQCLEDDDTTVRLQALELLTGMVSRSNLTDIVWKLMEHVRDSDADTVYRDELIKKILFICSRDHYKYV